MFGKLALILTSALQLAVSLQLPEPIAESFGLPNPDYQIRRLGFPSNDSTRHFENYVLSYDNRLRLARWVFEHLTPRSVADNPALPGRDAFKFREDTYLHASFRSKDADYKRNKLNMTRGHMAAAANHQLTFDHKQDTFAFSNIAPQVGNGFNGGMWSRLEGWVRNLTSVYKNVFVVTGPLFSPQFDDFGEFVLYRLIGNSRVAVPTDFFKVVLAEHNTKDFFYRWAFVMPNMKIDNGLHLDTFLVKNIKELQSSSGLLFFDQIPSAKIYPQPGTGRIFRSMHMTENEDNHSI